MDVNSIDQGNLVHDAENEMLLDIWSDAKPGNPGKVLVPKKKRNIFENFLKENGVQFKIEVENIKK